MHSKMTMYTVFWEDSGLDCAKVFWICRKENGHAYLTQMFVIFWKYAPLVVLESLQPARVVAAIYQGFGSFLNYDQRRRDRYEYKWDKSTNVVLIE